MKRIGITGPTGAGKTTALGALEELGACVIDADPAASAPASWTGRERWTARPWGALCSATPRPWPI